MKTQNNIPVKKTYQSMESRNLNKIAKRYSYTYKVTNAVFVILCAFVSLWHSINVCLTTAIFKSCTILFIIFLFCFYPFFATSQVNPAHYFSETISLSSHYNPALTCKADFFLGVPFLTSFNLEVRNSFKYNDYIVRENDSLWVSPSKLINSLDEINYSAVVFNYDIIYCGFRKGNNYFRFGLRNRFTSYNSYSVETAALLFTGNSQFIGKTTAFQNNFSATNLYQEYYISYTRTIAGKFSIGITPKFLTGVFNVWTENANFELTIDENNYNHLVKTNMNIHTSSPLPDFKKFIDRLKQIPWIQFSNNTGYAIDLGLSYTVNRKLQLTASVIDLGKIRWNKNVKNFTSNSDEEISFEGLDLGNIFEAKKYTGATTSDMLTGLSESFGLKETNDSYTAPLSAKVLFAGAYSFCEKNKFGILTCTEQINNKWLNTYAVNYSRQVGNWLLASINYSFSKYFPNSLGIALELQTDELQIIIATNNVHGYLNPHDTKSYNLQIGLIWQINREHKKKTRQTSVSDEIIENL